jgi:hypothetical protein
MHATLVMWGRCVYFGTCRRRALLEIMGRDWMFMLAGSGMALRLVVWAVGKGGWDI